MTEAAQRDQWNHTAALLALMANANRDPKKRRKAYEPADFHPHQTRRSKADRIQLTSKETAAALKSIFIDRKL